MAAKKPSTKSKQRVKKPTKSEMLEEAADLLSRIEEAERRCAVAQLRIESRKAAYRNARNAYADCVEELHKLARARAENHPLFDQAEKQQQAQETQSAA